MFKKIILGIFQILNIEKNFQKNRALRSDGFSHIFDYS